MNLSLSSALVVGNTNGARVAIAGGPRTGKSLLAARIGGEHGFVLRSTDELIGKFEWSALSEEVARWFDLGGSWVCEGVRIPHAVRKWLAAHPTGLPADYFMWLETVHVPLTPGQSAMAKGVAKVWSECLPELRRRGAKIFTDVSGGPL